VTLLTSRHGGMTRSSAAVEKPRTLRISYRIIRPCDKMSEVVDGYGLQRLNIELPKCTLLPYIGARRIEQSGPNCFHGLLRDPDIPPGHIPRTYSPRTFPCGQFPLPLYVV